jgi:electron transfer flavoprotein beta subunit
MRVLVCVKRVPAPGAKINVTDDGLAVDAAFLGFTTSPHEECAVEAALQLVEAHGGETTVLTVGPEPAEEQLRYAASLGVQRCVLVPIAPADGSPADPDWDPQRTAAAITSAVRTLEAADGPFDLVLFGNESADSGGFQVGVRVAVALDRPIVNGAKGIDLDGAALVVRRESDAGLEIYELELPAVVGVKEGINLPRYPTMKGRLASKKVAVERCDVDGPVGGLQLVQLAPPPADDRVVTILGHGPDAAVAVVDLLAELGVLG